MKRICLLLVCLVSGGNVLGSQPAWPEPRPASGSAREPRTFDLGFIASRQVDVNGDLRLRALGPVFERAESPQGQQLRAVRPLYAMVHDPGDARTRRDLLWPVGSAETFKNMSSWRVLLAHHWNRDLEDPEPPYRFWLLPVYFQGRDADKEEYLAVFPIGGRIHEFLGGDRISFALWPLWIRHSIGPVVTQDYLWPFISRTEGKGIYRFRVFPFYGQSKHRDKFVKRFIMWPFWTSARFNYRGSEGKGFVLFPLFGRIRLHDQESWLFLPPLFRFSRGERLNLTYCPWPLFQRSTGEIEKLYIWPLWGRKRAYGIQRTFWLWPIFHSETGDRGDIVKERFVTVPFIYSEAHRKRTRGEAVEPEVVERYFKLWPLFSYRREQDRRRFRTLALWPLKSSAPIERCYAPLWTLYSRTAIADSSDTELLWGLYRYRRRGRESSAGSVFPLVSWENDRGEEQKRAWSLLWGLVGYERRATQKSLRLLYFIRLGKKEADQ